MQPSQPIGRLQRQAMMKGGGNYAPAKPEVAVKPRSTGIGSLIGGVAGGIGGGFLGSAVPFAGTAAGGIAGGAAGSALGEALEQTLFGGGINDAGAIAREGALGLAGGVVGKGISAAAKAGRASGVLGKIAPSKLLTKGAEDLSVRGLRANPSQLTNFAKTHGEDVTETLARHGLQGADEAGISKVATKLQGGFDKIAGRTDIFVSKADLRERLAKRLEPLLKSGAGDDKLMAQQLQQEFNGFLKSIKGNKVDLASLTKNRQNYDKLTKTFKDDAFGSSKNRSMGTLLRQTVQDAADNAKLVGPEGRTLKETGLELSKLIDLEDIATKQANLGRGSLPLGITTLLGGGIGTAGGPGGALMGALAGAAATKVANSPTTARLGAKAMTAAGRSMSEGGRLAGPGIGSQLAGQAGVRAVAGGMAGPQTSPEAGGATTAPGMLPDSDLSALDSQMAGGNVGKGFLNEDMMNALLVQALNQPDAKSQKEGLALVSALMDIQAKMDKTGSGSKKPLSAEASKQVANANSGLRSINQLESILMSDPNKANADAIAGLGGNVGRAALGTQQFSAAKREIIDVISRSRSGAALTPKEISNYEKALPRFGDSPEMAREKLARFRSLFEDMLSLQEQGSPDLEMLR